MGGGMSDIVIFFLGDIVFFQLVWMVGDKMNIDIIEYIKVKYGLVIGEYLVE